MADAVVLVGLVLGSVVILAVVLTWWQKQIFGTGGSILSVVGLVLVGLSIWGRVSFTIGDIEVNLERLNERIDRVAEAGAEVSEAVANVAGNAETTQQQFVALTRMMESGRTPSPQQLQELRQRLLAQPVVERTQLNRATELFRGGVRPPNR